MNILYDEFSTEQVVKATGVSGVTLQSWIKRGVIVGERGDAAFEGGRINGKPRRFRFYTVMEIAVAAALIDCGVSDLRNAFSAARTFAHSGIGQSLDKPSRQPSLPFDTTKNPHAHTTLYVYRDKSHVDYETPERKPIREAVKRKIGDPVGYIALDMNRLVDRVVAALGYHPEQVIEAAYADDCKADPLGSREGE